MRCFIFFFTLTCSVLFGSPQSIYLTLPEDPAHSMSVHWIEKKQKGSFNTLFYQKKGEVHWEKMSLTSMEGIGSSSFLVKQCLITQLDPSTNYSFYLEGDTAIHSFRTLPLELKDPLHIVVAGDLMESFSLYHRMNQVVITKNPDFVVLAGDIAYATGLGFSRGKHGSVTKWVTFFKEWQKTMVGKDGRMIPMTALVGNHDVTSTDRKEKGKNSFFFKFFPSSQDLSYQRLDVSGVISLFLLDTGHLFSIDEVQKKWLENSLKETETKWKVPIYHISAYPSVYSPDTKIPKQIRKHWVPLFEKYGVKLAFEHHNHAFKRTFSLLEGKQDPKGIVYLGDGGYGSAPRKVKKEPYLEKAAALSSFSLLTVESDLLKVEVFNIKNELVDTWQSKGL